MEMSLNPLRPALICSPYFAVKIGHELHRSADLERNMAQKQHAIVLLQEAESPWLSHTHRSVRGNTLYKHDVPHQANAKLGSGEYKRKWDMKYYFPYFYELGIFYLL